MRKQKSCYERPMRPWDKARIEKEAEIIKQYGLRRKKEIWRATAILRKYRGLARELVATKDKERERILIAKMSNIGLIHSGLGVDDILALKVENVLERRLQTIVFKKGIAKTMNQSRQFIVHGHIAINGKRATWPSTLVPIDEEAMIKFYPKSTLKDLLTRKPEPKIEAPKSEPKIEAQTEGVKNE